LYCFAMIHQLNPQCGPTCEIVAAAGKSFQTFQAFAARGT
jgi:hypothetical protein